MTERSKFRPSPTRSWREKKKEGCVSNDWNRASIELVYVRYQDEPSPQYRGRPRRTNDHAAGRVKHLPRLPTLQVKKGTKYLLHVSPPVQCEESTKTASVLRDVIRAKGTTSHDWILTPS